MARKKKNAGSAPLTAPETREEHYLAKIAGLVDTKPEYPFTRIERYLDAIADSSGFSPTEAQLAAMNSGATAEKIGAIEEKVPLVGKGINLLDNWYFLNPVNQRGQNSYSGQGYTIDRWSKVTATGTVAVVSGDGIQLTSDGGATDTRFYQPLEFPALLYGKQCTASCLYKYSGETSWRLMKQTVTIPNNAWIDSSTNDGKWACGFWNVGIRLYNVIASAPVIIVKAVKLELGSQQTLARQVNGAWVLNDPAPNYQQELAKCQRYFVDVIGVLREYGIIANGYATSSTAAIFVLHFPVTMRDVPTMSMTGGVQLSGDIDGTLAMSRGNANSASVIFTTSTATITEKMPIGLRQKFVPDAHIFFSAEL